MDLQIGQDKLNTAFVRSFSESIGSYIEQRRAEYQRLEVLLGQSEEKTVSASILRKRARSAVDFLVETTHRENEERFSILYLSAVDQAAQNVSDEKENVLRYYLLDKEIALDWLCRMEEFQLRIIREVECQLIDFNKSAESEKPLETRISDLEATIQEVMHDMEMYFSDHIPDSLSAIEKKIQERSTGRGFRKKFFVLSRSTPEPKNSNRRSWRQKINIRPFSSWCLTGQNTRWSWSVCGVIYGNRINIF